MPRLQNVREVASFFDGGGVMNLRATWQCNHCGEIKYREEEIYCWKCGKGEMIYKGKCSEVSDDNLQENPDGSWTPAVPVAYHYDNRTVWLRVWAVVSLLWKRTENVEVE